MHHGIDHTIAAKQIQEAWKCRFLFIGDIRIYEEHTLSIPSGHGSDQLCYARPFRVVSCRGAYDQASCGVVLLATDVAIQQLRQQYLNYPARYWVNVSMSRVD